MTVPRNAANPAGPKLSRPPVRFFGHHDDYVSTLGRHNLDQLIELGTAARQKLANPQAEDR